MSEPETKSVRARDVQPWFWGQWCSIEDGEPFTNVICSVRWSDDGEHLWFMLETHNFFKAKPDEILELVSREPSEYHRSKPPFVLPPRPIKKTCPTCGHVETFATPEGTEDEGEK